MKSQWAPTIFGWLAVIVVLGVLALVLRQPLASTAGLDPLALPNALITAAGLILSVISVVLVLLGVLGFNELRRIREVEEQLRKSVAEFEAARVATVAFMAEMDQRAASLRSDISLQLSHFLEAAYHFSLGESSYKQGQFEKALTEYARALAIRPGDTAITLRKGRALVNLGRTDEARAEFEAVLAQGENAAEAHYGMATALRYSDPARAAEEAEKAVALNPASCDLWNYLGLLYRDQGRYEDAIARHTEALRCDAYSQTYCYLALLHARQGQADLARANIAMAMAMVEHDLNKGDVRPVWAEVIRWSHAVLHGRDADAEAIWVGVERLLTTDRLRSTVRDHVEFLKGDVPAAADSAGGRKGGKS